MPDAKAIHEKGVSTARQPLMTEWHKHKGMVRFYRKFFRNTYPTVLFGLAIIGIWIRFAMIAVAIFLGRKRA